MAVFKPGSHHLTDTKSARTMILNFPVSRIIIRVCCSNYQVYGIFLCTLSHFSHIQLFATPWTVAHQAPLSIGFPGQEYWSGFLCLPPGDLPNPGIKPVSLMSPALAGGFFTTSATCLVQVYRSINTWPWLDAKNKGSDTKKFATANHAPSPSFQEKGFAESFGGVWGF